MACNLTYTVRSTYPRLFCLADDKSAITTRTNTAASWQHVWDSHLIAQANASLALSDEDLSGTDDNIYFRFLTLGICGWIDGTTTYHTKLMSAAVHFASTASQWQDWTTLRYQIMALAVAYDFLRSGTITFASAYRKIIGDAIVTLSDASPDTEEYLDGHSAGNCMACLIGALAIAGESGTGYNYTSWAATKIDQMLGFFYGTTAGGDCLLDAERYYGASGGHWQGPWYSIIRAWITGHVLWTVDHALIQNSETPSSLQLLGEDYSVSGYETWLTTFPEWWINVACRGDYDFWDSADTEKSTYWYHPQLRFNLGFAAAYGGSGWQSQMRTIYDLLQAKQDSLSQYANYMQAEDPLLWDPSVAVAYATGKLPEDAADKTALLSPPGICYHRTSWDYPNSCAIMIDSQERAYRGHPHLGQGGLKIEWKGDMVLPDSGIYATWCGAHHKRWYQLSIAHSGVPLIDDPTYTHRDYYTPNGGSMTTLPTGLGGQVWKEYVDGGVTKTDVFTLSKLLYDGSGNGWKLAVNTLTDSTDYAHLVCDLRYCYVKFATEKNSSTERARDIVINYLIIKNESLWPIVFRVVRVEGRQASFLKRDNFHSYHAWTVTYPIAPETPSGMFQRASANGYRGIGKCVVDLYNYQDFVTTVYGGGSLDAYGWPVNSFKVDALRSAPESAGNYRDAPDCGLYRLEFKSLGDRTTNQFVEVIHALGVGETPHAYTWIDEDAWYGIRFSDTEHEYRISKTTNNVSVVSGGSSGAPAAPTGLTATAGDEQVVLTWNPNAESAMNHYHIYKREAP